MAQFDVSPPWPGRKMSSPLALVQLEERLADADDVRGGQAAEPRRMSLR